MYVFVPTYQDVGVGVQLVHGGPHTSLRQHRLLEDEKKSGRTATATAAAPTREGGEDEVGDRHADAMSSSLSERGAVPTTLSYREFGTYLSTYLLRVPVLRQRR